MTDTALHPAELDPEKLLVECRVQTTRRGGPGGQHRNKVETAVVITHLPSGVAGQAAERRSQKANRDAAVDRLRVNLALAVRTRRAESAVPSTRWRERLSGRRLRIRAGHGDFAPLLAEALDVLEERQMDVPGAAAALHCSSSQLLKLLRMEPAAFRWLNDRRRHLGLHPMS